MNNKNIDSIIYKHIKVIKKYEYKNNYLVDKPFKRVAWQSSNWKRLREPLLLVLT